MKQLIHLILLLFICYGPANAQDSTLKQLPEKYLSDLRRKFDKFEEQVDKRTEKALARFIKQEQRMKSKLWKSDSLSAKTIFNSSISKMEGLKSGLSKRIPGGGDAYLDTLTHTLKFLDQYNNVSKKQLAGAEKSVGDLQGKLQQAEAVKAYIRSRKQELKEQLSQYSGFAKDLERFNKEAYYYGEQLKEYKSLFQDRKKAEAKAMTMLKKLPAYNDFLRKHSQLAGLFNLNGSYNETRNLEGLQTRTQVDQLLQQRIGSGQDARQAVSQQMEQARSQFTELKSKFPDLDNAADMPDFKPNPMKTKSFVQRLEFGGNIQFQKSSRYFPTTSDFAAQVAYKFHKNGSAGIGAAYKLGMGSGWDHIVFSHVGLGLRSFIDWKLKGTFFLNGGVEKDYLIKNWKTSALLGISKKYKINTKLKGNIILLYDFLAQRQIPQTSPIKLRIGYSL